MDGESLLHLADIDKILEPVRKAEIAEHRLGDAGIAALVLLVAFHHRRGNVEVVLGGEFADDRHRRIGLESEFRAEPRLYITVMFEITPLMPDRPEMHVA